LISYGNFSNFEFIMQVKILKPTLNKNSSNFFELKIFFGIDRLPSNPSSYSSKIDFKFHILRYRKFRQTKYFLEHSQAQSMVLSTTEAPLSSMVLGS
jgi:hypothetical protein